MLLAIDLHGKIRVMFSNPTSRAFKNDVKIFEDVIEIAGNDFTVLVKTC